MMKAGGIPNPRCCPRTSRSSLLPWFWSSLYTIVTYECVVIVVRKMHTYLYHIGYYDKFWCFDGCNIGNEFLTNFDERSLVSESINRWISMVFTSEMHLAVLASSESTQDAAQDELWRFARARCRDPRAAIDSGLLQIDGFPFRLSR